MQATIRNVGADSRKFVAAALLLVAIVFVVALLAFTGHQATPARTLFGGGTQAQSAPAGGQSTTDCQRGCHGALP
jgi:hypothetical protein